MVDSQAQPMGNESRRLKRVSYELLKLRPISHWPMAYTGWGTRAGETTMDSGVVPSFSTLSSAHRNDSHPRDAVGVRKRIRVTEFFTQERPVACVLSGGIQFIIKHSDNGPMYQLKEALEELGWVCEFFTTSGSTVFLHKC